MHVSHIWGIPYSARDGQKSCKVCIHPSLSSINTCVILFSILKRSPLSHPSPVGRGIPVENSYRLATWNRNALYIRHRRGRETGIIADCQGVHTRNLIPHDWHSNGLDEHRQESRSSRSRNLLCRHPFAVAPCCLADELISVIQAGIVSLGVLAIQLWTPFTLSLSDSTAVSASLCRSTPGTTTPSTWQYTHNLFGSEL